jgi:hypothetical protein
MMGADGGNVRCKSPGQITFSLVDGLLRQPADPTFLAGSAGSDPDLDCRHRPLVVSQAHLLTANFWTAEERQETEDAFRILTNGLWVGDHSVRDHDPRGRGEDNSREALKPDLNYSVTWVWWS